MLHSMQPKAESVSSSAPTDFAGLLAALTAPAPTRSTAWSGATSAEEFASVSYEKALRTPRKSDSSQEDAPNQSRRAQRPVTRRAAPEPAPVAETDSAADVHAALRQAIAALGQKTSPATGAHAVHSDYIYEEEPNERKQWIQRPLAGPLAPEPEPEPVPPPAETQSPAERLRTILAQKIAEQRAEQKAAERPQRPSIHAQPVQRVVPKVEEPAPAAPRVRRVAARPQTAARMAQPPIAPPSFAGTIESVLNPEIEPPSWQPQARPASRAARPTGSALATRNPAAVKNASITIRMSNDDCDQLRQRAAEADMSVSAYLRSCAFEMESLRAQVKEAVAQMRLQAPAPAYAPENPAAIAVARPQAERTGWFSRLRSFLFGAPLPA